MLFIAIGLKTPQRQPCLRLDTSPSTAKRVFEDVIKDLETGMILSSGGSLMPLQCLCKGQAARCRGTQ